MKQQFTLRRAFVALSIIMVLCAWYADRGRLLQKVQSLQQQVDTQSRIVRIAAGDWRERREEIDRIKKDFDPTAIPLLLLAMSDPDPGVRVRAMEVLETVRLNVRTLNQNPDPVNTQPEYAFWSGVLAVARTNSADWEQIKVHIEQLNQENPPTENPFLDAEAQSNASPSVDRVP